MNQRWGCLEGVAQVHPLAQVSPLAQVCGARPTGVACGPHAMAATSPWGPSSGLTSLGRGPRSSPRTPPRSSPRTPPTGALTWHGVGKLLPVAPHIPCPVAGVSAVAREGRARDHKGTRPPNLHQCPGRGGEQSRMEAGAPGTLSLPPDSLGVQQQGRTGRKEPAGQGHCQCLLGSHLCCQTALEDAHVTGRTRVPRPSTLKGVRGPGQPWPPTSSPCPSPEPRAWSWGALGFLLSLLHPGTPHLWEAKASVRPYRLCRS